MVHSRKVWIGLSDRGTEGQWRFPINNKIFNTQNANNVFHWHAGEPNNGGNGLMDDVNCDDKLYGLKPNNGGWGNQDCVYVGYGGNGLMDDVNCDDKLYGLCEIKIVDCDKPGFYLE